MCFCATGLRHPKILVTLTAFHQVNRNGECFLIGCVGESHHYRVQRNKNKCTVILYFELSKRGGMWRREYDAIILKTEGPDGIRYETDKKLIIHFEIR